VILYYVRIARGSRLGFRASLVASPPCLQGSLLSKMVVMAG
jgi:hypothetical protein